MTQATETMALPAAIERTLGRLIWRARLAIILRGVLATAAAALAGVLLVIAIRSLFVPVETWQHYALTLLWLGIAAAAAVLTLLRPMARSFTLAGMARAVESRHPELQERLSTTVELLSSGDAAEIRGSAQLIAAVARQAAGDAQLVQPRREVTFRRARPFLLSFAAAALVLAGLLAVFPGRAGRALVKTVIPWANVASVFADELVVGPGDKVLLAGSSLHAELAAANNRLRGAQIRIAREGEVEKTYPMAALGEGRFQYDTERLYAGLRYRIRAGDALTRYYTVTVVPPPQVEAVQVGYTYPLYTKLPAIAPTAGSGEIAAPVGTAVKVLVELSKPVSSCRLSLPDAPAQLRQESPTSYSFELTLQPGLAGKWRVDLEDQYGFATRGQEHSITAIADGAPTVEILRPVEKALKLRPADRLPIAYRLEDDFGFSAACLLVKVDDRPQPPMDVPFAQADLTASAPQPGQVTSQAQLDLSALPLAGARTVKFALQATDNCPPEMGGPHVGVSQERTITLDAAAVDYAVQAELAAELRLRESLQKIFAELTEARKISTPLRESMVSTSRVTQPTVDKLDDMLGHLSVSESQTRKLAEQITEGEFPQMGRTLWALADEHIARARECGQLVKISDQQKLRADNAEEADVQVIRALDIVSDLLKKLDVLTDLARRAVELDELADKEDRLARAEVTTQPVVQPASGPADPQQSPPMSLADWQKAQAVLATRVAELARKTPGAQQAQAQQLNRQTKDLLDAAHKLQKAQDTLSTDTARQQAVQAIPDELAKLAAEQSKLDRQAEALARQAATASAPAQSADAQPASTQPDQATTSPAPTPRQLLADIAQQQRATRDKASALKEQLPRQEQSRKDAELRRLRAQQQQIEKELADLADQVKQKAPSQERPESKAILAARQASEELAAAKPDQAARSAAQAAQEMNKLADQLDQQSRQSDPSAQDAKPDGDKPGEDAGQGDKPAQVQAAAPVGQEPQQVAAEGPPPQPEELAKMSDQARDLWARQQQVARQADLLAKDQMPKLLADRQAALTQQATDLRKDLALVGQYIDTLAPDAQAAQLASAAQRDLQHAQTAQQTASDTLRIDRLAQAAPWQQNSSTALAQAAGNLKQLGQRLADMARQSPPAKTPEDAQDAQDLAEAAKDSRDAAIAGKLSDAQQAAELLDELARHAQQAAQALGVNPQAAAETAAAMQSPTGEPGKSPQGPSQGRARVGSAEVDLSPAELKAMGIAPDDWARFKGALDSQLLQGDQQAMPEEYRQLIKRYFQAIAAKNQGAPKK